MSVKPPVATPVVLAIATIRKSIENGCKQPIPLIISRVCKAANLSEQEIADVRHIVLNVTANTVVKKEESIMPAKSTTPVPPVAPVVTPAPVQVPAVIVKPDSYLVPVGKAGNLSLQFTVPATSDMQAVALSVASAQGTALSERSAVNASLYIVGAFEVEGDTTGKGANAKISVNVWPLRYETTDHKAALTHFTRLMGKLHSKRVRGAAFLFKHGQTPHVATAGI